MCLFILFLFLALIALLLFNYPQSSFEIKFSISTLVQCNCCFVVATVLSASCLFDLLVHALRYASGPRSLAFSPAAPGPPCQMCKHETYCEFLDISRVLNLLCFRSLRFVICVVSFCSRSRRLVSFYIYSAFSHTLLVFLGTLCIKIFSTWRMVVS